MSRIMIVDDESGVLNALRRLLLSVPCSYGRLTYKLEVETFDTPVAALERARQESFDLFLADYRMPGMNGVEFLAQVREIQPDAARLIISGYADLNAFADAVNGADIFRFLSKPWNDYVLVSAIAQALNYRELMLENHQLAAQACVQRATAAGGDTSPAAATKVRWGADGSAIIEDAAVKD